MAALRLIEGAIDVAVGVAGNVIGINKNPFNGLTKTIDDATKYYRDAEKDLSAVSDGQRFHLLFEDAVKEMLSCLDSENENTDDKRLVIFIDDLDRCEENVIVKLLEAIKLYLSSRHCVFVMGLDDGAVLDALKRYWKERSFDANRDYLNKLFQAMVVVPLPVANKLSASISQQLEKNKISFYQELSKEIERLIEPNPRKVKNFTNSFCIAWHICAMANHLSSNNEEEKKKDAKRFLWLHYLRVNHRSVWRLLERDPSSFKYLLQVLTNATGADADADDQSSGNDNVRLFKDFYFRAFSHVLSRDFKEEFHGSVKLADAVSEFHQRQDRNRSDKYFCTHFVDLFDENYSLPDYHFKIGG